jgi:hypothetical protein
MPFHSGAVRNLAMWDALQRELTQSRALFSNGMGDQVYADGERDIDIWRWLKKIKKYAPSDADMVSGFATSTRYWGMHRSGACCAASRLYMIWTHHEIKDGWGSYQRDELSNDSIAISSGRT